ncbi:MAG: hypothetical protein JWL95_572 [Gemmatimonadetes bacterium]|nr:hypothetical protein [Gemmatimonadota bacterium]
MTPDRELVQRIKPFRRELLAHCYRMLGSVDDAEDVVQETYLRAWRAYDTLEDPASLRAWLYRIATNACLTALEQRKRRALPSGHVAPTPDPDALLVLAGADVEWIEPIPDALVTGDDDDPAARAAAREGLRLARIASLQYLPPRQRAIQILREVLAFSAEEVATMLDLTAAAVKSSLQRARARIDEVTPAAELVREPTQADAKAVLDRYVAAFESSDPTAIGQLLCADATLEMTPFLTWFQGKQTCAPHIVRHALGSPGEWRMVPTTANGQVAAIAYRRGGDGAYLPFGVAVLTVRASQIARIAVFGGAKLVERFESARLQ